ncbi:Toll/interleukin-1 receptor domain-containing protein [Tanacetum coccineum]
MVDFVPGRAVIDATHRKRVKYEAKCADIGYGFLPFSFSSLGKLEMDVVTLLKRIRKFSMTRDIGARAAIHIFNMISFAIAKRLVRHELFQDIKSKDDRLANLDSPVKDTSLVTYAVNGIRSKYPDTARVIRLREKAPTFNELRSMMLLEESDMSTQSVRSSLLHTSSSSSPTVLVASTTPPDKATTMSTSGLDVCRNFQRGSCSYDANCPGCFPQAQQIPMTDHQPLLQAQPHAFGPIGPFQPARIGNQTSQAQHVPPGPFQPTPYTVAPQIQQPGSMMFPNYAMSSSYLP